MIRKRILGALGLVLGGGLVLHGLANGFGSTGGSFRAGQITAYLICWVLAVLGLDALVGRRRTEEFEW